jgi:hypothetical protein
MKETPYWLPKSNIVFRCLANTFGPNVWFYDVRYYHLVLIGYKRMARDEGGSVKLDKKYASTLHKMV